MKLIKHWRLWWRRASTWGAAFNAALWAYITSHSGMLLGFLPFIPKDWRGAATGIVFAVTFILPVLIVNIRQTKLAEKVNPSKEASDG